MALRRILYLQYTNPGGYPPLEHQSRILADAGWDVLFVGTGAHGAERLTFPPHPRIRVRRVAFCRPGWRQKLHYLAYAAWALATAADRGGLVYVSDPLTAPVGLLAYWLLRAKVVYHEHDSPGPPQTRADRVWHAARRRLARVAQACVLPNRERLVRFVADTGRAGPTFLVWNCPRRDEVSPPRPPTADGTVRVLYHGTLVPERLPMSVVEAVARAGDRVRLRAVGYETVGAKGYPDRLRAVAAAAGVGDRVEVLPAVPRHAMWALVRECDVGLGLLPLATDDINFGGMIGASNKVYDYLAAGLPVVVTDLPGWRAEYVDPGYARSARPDDPASLAAALRWFADHPAETRAMGEAGRRQVLAAWNYETQFGPVKRFLDELADRSSVRAEPSTPTSCP